MDLGAGTKLGGYEIQEPIGAGGMGEVYRALDHSLNRVVAIKVLPEQLSENEDRLSRFRREATLLASLNHPNIATVHGFDESGERPFLVMELVEGDTLAERLAGTKLGSDEVVTWFREIASGLHAAHAKGIVHRDLKPANIMITAAGTPKLVDFGLAKPSDLHQSRSAHSEAATLGKDTRTGVALGTPSYMSPEQARGESVDERTDIWAFGCCLFESLTAKKAFDGGSVANILVSVLEHDPDWARLPKDTPSGVRRVLRRCLSKDPEKRLHDIADARIELDDLDEEPAAAAGPTRRTSSLWLASAFVAGAVTAWLFSRGPEIGTPPPVSLQLPLAVSSTLAIQERPPLAISPDGSTLVYVGVGDDGTLQLYVHRLDELEAEPIPDTTGASGPFFSPSGETVAYFSGLELRSIGLGANASQWILSGSPVTRGASWLSAEEMLLTASKSHGLARISVNEGTFEMASAPDAETSEMNHSWSDPLPGGRSTLVSIAKLGRESYDTADVALVELSSGSVKTLIRGGYAARYVPGGHLVYMSAGSLMAVPFSLERLEISGDPIVIASGVICDPRTGAAYYDVSETGTLVYATGPPIESSNKRLTWVDRDGRKSPVTAEMRAYGYPRLSPDGRRLAVAIEAESDDLWIYDLDRDAFTRLTFEGRNFAPAWSPDGARLAFSSTAGVARPQIAVQPSDGSGRLQNPFRVPFAAYNGSWSPDGSELALTGSPGQLDIYLATLDGREPAAWLASRFREVSPTFSPDGRWLAYASDESGRSEVYVRARTGDSAKFQISTEGGEEPVWSGDGGELFYRSGNRMVAAVVSTQTGLIVERTELVFEGRFERSDIPGLRHYDVSDESRFIMVEPARTAPGPTALTVVMNGFAVPRP